MPQIIKTRISPTRGIYSEEIEVPEGQQNSEFILFVDGPISASSYVGVPTGSGGGGSFTGSAVNVPFTIGLGLTSSNVQAAIVEAYNHTGAFTGSAASVSLVSSTGLTSSNVQLGFDELSARGYNRLPLDGASRSSWRYDGTILDSSGRGNNLSLSPGSTSSFGAGPRGRKILKPTTSNLGIMTATGADLANKNDVTVEFVGVLGNLSGTGVIAVCGGGNWCWAVEVFYSGSDFARIFVSDGGNEYVDSTLSMPTSFTHFATTIASVGGGVVINMYINGVPAGSRTIPSFVLRNPDDEFRVLGWINDSSYLASQFTEVHEIHISAGARTPADIEARAKIALPPGYG